MTYKETISLITSLNHLLNTSTLTRTEAKELITKRELIWNSYKN